MRTQKRQVYIVSSTHWDREWYETFQTFRFHLVKMMDELLDVLEDESYRCFFLDGQTVILEDYLEVRPYQRAKVEALLKEGRILVGPWYTMPDLNLSSGETIIRNLCRGTRIAHEFGAKPPVIGHMCDIFGFPAQIPQIFRRGFGIDQVTLYRGLSEGTPEFFEWEGSDHSVVQVQRFHPDLSYGTFFFLTRYPFRRRETPVDPEEIVRRVREFLAEYPAGNEPILLMDGVDFIAPTRETVALIEMLRQKLPEYEWIQSDFSDYFRAAKQAISKRLRISGPIYRVGRTGAQNRLLKNVLSSQSEIKRNQMRCETLLAQIAEPLDGFLKMGNFQGHPPFQKFAAFRQDFFSLAWKWILQNSAHDSICGCSISETHEDNRNRYRQVVDLLSANLKEEMGQLSHHLRTEHLTGKSGYLLFYNPSALPCDETMEAEIFEKTGESQQNYRIYDSENQPVPYRVIAKRKTVRKAPGFQNSATHTYCDATKIALRVSVPAYGYTVYSYDSLRTEWDEELSYRYISYYPPQRMFGSMRISDDTFENNFLLVRFCASSGTISVTDKRTKVTYDPLLFLEDSRDDGDGYQYRPVLGNPTGCSAPSQVWIQDETPDFVRIGIRRGLQMPMSVEPDASTVEHLIVLRRESTRLDVETRVRNFQRTRRLRVGFGFGESVTQFYTKMPFDWTEWSVNAYDNREDVEEDTRVVPNQGAIFVKKGSHSLAIYNQGLYECEVSERRDGAIFLTLFRSIQRETWKAPEEVQKLLPEEFCLKYALDFVDSNCIPEEIIRRSDAYRIGIFCHQFEHSHGVVAAEDTFLQVTGNALISAFYQEDDEFVLRIYHLGDSATGEIKFYRRLISARETNMEGKTVNSAQIEDGKILYCLRPKEIKTYRVAFDTES